MRQKNVALISAIAAAGLSGQELAARCGIHPVTVSHLVNLRVTPKPETARALAKCLNTTPTKLGFFLKGGAL